MKNDLLRQLRKKCLPLTILGVVSTFLYLQHHWQWFV